MCYYGMQAAVRIIQWILMQKLITITNLAMLRLYFHLPVTRNKIIVSLPVYRSMFFSLSVYLFLILLSQPLL